jgi:hypothetical protein
MQSKITLVIALVLLASCSAPKYTYYFSHYRNDVAKNQQHPAEVSPALDNNQLMASVGDEPAMLTGVSAEPVMVADVSAKAVVEKPIQQLSKSQRVQLKRELRKYVKSQKKAGSIESVKSTKAMDHDLKLAAIFGAVGIVGLALNGIATVFGIIGGIAFLIGVVFFVKWIIRQ